MASDAERLAELLPLHVRKIDAVNGEALRALLAVLGEQVDLIQTDFERLYRNLFVETAEPWAVPYLGDLVGYRLLPGHEEALGQEGADALVARLAPPRDVADTVASRRRKGTLPMLEELAASVADWPARAVEFHRLLLRHQPIRLYPGSDLAASERTRAALGSIDVRREAQLIRLGGPFETQGHLAEAARITSPVRLGRYRPPNVGVFVWRLKPYSITRAPAYCIDRARNQFTFSILGNDSPLVTRPSPEPSSATIAESEHVPAFISRRELAERLPDSMGVGKSFAIWRDDDEDPIPLADVVVADLSHWFYRAKDGQVVVDPELGRIAFGPRVAPRRGVSVTYHYAFPADIGGGEYFREIVKPRGASVYRVGPDQPYRRIGAAYEAWQHDNADGERPEAVIEIAHSGAYQEQLEFVVGPGDRLELRAAEGVRPVLRLLDWYSNRPDSLQIKGIESDQDTHLPPPRFAMDGLLVTGRGVSVTGPVGSVAFRHSTLVPGWSLEPHCHPTHPQEPSLVLEDTSACVQIDHSILGTILVINDEVHGDPISIHLTDSILDATAPQREALSAPDCRHAHAILHAERATVIGEVHAFAVQRGEDCIFDGLMHVARRGIGCLRFCYVTPTSCSESAGDEFHTRTPQRYHCQPDLAWAELRRLADDGDIDPADLPRLRELESSRIRPQFTDRHYGTPGYLQLARSCAAEVWRGAEDRSEMGVHHNLYQPQREDNLRARLADFAPAGTDAGIVFVS